MKKVVNLKRIFIYLIEIYQKYISPLKKPCCKYYPTCSAYAKQSIEKYGALRGSLMSVWRILRCNPFSNGGYDPVK